MSAGFVLKDTRTLFKGPAATAATESFLTQKTNLENTFCVLVPKV